MTHWTPYVFYLLIPALLALAVCSDNVGLQQLPAGV
jgi:hypothetical protein